VRNTPDSIDLDEISNIDLYVAIGCKSIEVVNAAQQTEVVCWLAWIVCLRYPYTLEGPVLLNVVRWGKHRLRGHIYSCWMYMNTCLGEQPQI
jgi:hypothetical protein